MARQTEGGSTQVHPAQPQYDVGVIIGRFQVHELHDAHRDLIEYVCSKHEKVIVFLGISPLMNSATNPLDFQARQKMIQEAFPDVIVAYVEDMADDDVWSAKLDKQVRALVHANQTVILYGGRDSFLPHYTGEFPTQELMQETFRSGAAVRKQIARSNARASADFRAGVIWASQSRFPTAYTTVDIAIVNEDGTKILLGRKPNEKLFRLIGGFADPKTESFEADAKREVMEETGLDVGDLRYIGSKRVDDWRYANEPDGIKTMLFTAKYLHGRPAPGDDIEEVQWFSFPDLRDNQIVPSHRPLMAMLRANREEK
jgi:bifunctional NMN adenylyltransferase/nudix hydrolase